MLGPDRQIRAMSAGFANPAGADGTIPQEQTIQAEFIL